MSPLDLRIDPSFFFPEEREGYVISAEMKKVWAVELDLLNEFSKVCEKHKLQWFVHAGTMLGAVRHQGFIPWDNDIDVIMPRDDYERFCQCAPSEFSHPIFFQNESTDRYFARAFSRLRNSETTAIFDNERSYQYPYNQGIFIDIFPMDHVPANLEERKSFYKGIIELNAKAVAVRTMIHFYRAKEGGGLFKRVSYFLKHLFYKYFFRGGYRYYMEKHHELITKYDSEETGWEEEAIVIPLGRHLWRTEWVRETMLVPFEMIQVPVPLHFDECLTASFGKDWKTPRKIGTHHGEVLFDADKPYTTYITHK